MDDRHPGIHRRHPGDTAVRRFIGWLKSPYRGMALVRNEPVAAAGLIVAIAAFFGFDLEAEAISAVLVAIAGLFYAVREAVTPIAKQQ